MADFNVEQGERVATAIQTARGDSTFVRVDISKADEVERMVADTVAAYGRVDAAVNNAALTPDDKLASDFDEDYWDRLMAVDLKGTARCIKYELRQMIAQGDGGSIINISSVSGFRPQPNKFGRADEIAQASLWLASDLSSYVTGTTLHVDAGYTSR